MTPWVSELRSLTVVFVQLREVDPAHWEQALQQLTLLIQEGLERWSGRAGATLRGAVLEREGVRIRLIELEVGEGADSPSTEAPPQSLADYEATGGYQGLKKALGMEPDDITQMVLGRLNRSTPPTTSTGATTGPRVSRPALPPRRRTGT